MIGLLLVIFFAVLMIYPLFIKDRTKSENFQLRGWNARYNSTGRRLRVVCARIRHIFDRRRSEDNGP